MHDVAFIDNLKGTPRVNAPGELPPPDDRLDEEVAHLRPPPKSIEAEQGVLGALVLDAAALPKVSDILATGDFFARSHQLVYDAISSLVAAGQSVDTLSVFERLERDGNAGDAGGLKYLNDLVQGTPSAANLRRYAEIVVERSNLRQIIKRADEVTARAFRNEPAADILADLGGAIGRLTEERKLGPAGIPLLTLSELREQSHAQAWIIKHVLPADATGMLFGASGTFKSYLAIDLACHVAHGLNWLGRRTKQGEVLYLAAEGGSGMWGRFCAWHKARRIPYEKAPITVMPVALDLTQDAGRVVEAAKAKGIKPTLVVVDTMSQTFGGEENSAAEVAAYFRALGARIQQAWGCTVLIIHHSGHSATERPRGSSAILANLGFMFGAHRDEREMLTTLSCLKQKDGDRFADTTFSLTPHRLGTDEDGDEVKSLVARHIASADDLKAAMDGEKKAGRGGNNHLLLSLLQNGALESEVRTEFMKQCNADNPEARKKAYQRAKQALIQGGLMDVAQGYVVVLFKDTD